MIRKSYNYEIRIRPLDYYFFGSEATFGNLEQQNYFAKTQLFPQQTTVIGMLRHLGYDKVDIGESFDASKSVQNLGYIKGISAVYLIDHLGRPYMPGPLGKGGYQALQLQSAGKGVTRWNGRGWTATYQAPDYAAKEGWEQHLVSGLSDPKKDHIPFDQVFQYFTKIGITKQVDECERKDGFYKQGLAKLGAGWSFSVLADLDAELAGKLPASSVMPFGAEKALFHLELKQLNAAKSFGDLFPDSLWELDCPEGLDAALLWSDAWAPADILQNLDFAVTDIRDFRYIRTPKQVKEFAKFYTHEDWQKYNQAQDHAAQQPNAHPAPVEQRLYKSGKYNLLARGSLLYGKKTDLETLLDQAAFQTVGYNQYTIISKL